MTHIRRILMALWCLDVCSRGVPSFTWSIVERTAHSMCPQDLAFKSRSPNQVTYSKPDRTSTELQNNNWFQDLVPNFLKERENDFVRLDESADVFGPGPMIVLYNVPSSMDDEEFRDMVSDGASIQECILHRIHLVEPSSSTTQDDSALLDVPMEEALTQLASSRSTHRSPTVVQIPKIPTNGVLFFSGFSNIAMMAVYKIMAQEIYQETAGANNVACAKAVPNAMQKPLRQVFDEISGDHQDAIRQ